MIRDLTLEYDVYISERQTEMFYFTKMPVAKIIRLRW